MNIRRFGISLKGIQPEDAALILSWRNADHVRMQMEESGLIKPEDHLHWMEKIRDGKNFYFLSGSGAGPWAVTNVKNIDWTNSTGEGGIFTGESSRLGSPESAIAVLAMMDVFIGLFGLKRMIAKVKRSNTTAIEFNKALGYEVMPDFPTPVSMDLAHFEITPEKYFRQTSGFRTMLLKRYGRKTVLTWESSDGEFAAAAFRNRDKKYEEFFQLDSA